MARNFSKHIGLSFTAFSFAALALTSLSFTSLVGFGPALAADGSGEGQGGTGAKGLFFEQLEKPKENLNTGLRYWIEMKRNGTMQRVTNKTQFKSGDSIRFHVRSNINGYAYILLSSGSRGEQSVLFPDAATGEPNRLESGREYILPQGGALTFDENPGTEKLTLLLSRTPIDAQTYLAKPAAEKEITLIASAQEGSKDLVPARIYIAMSAPHSDGPPPILIASSNKPSNPADRIGKGEDNDKPAKAAKPVKKKVKVSKKDETKKVASAPSTSSTAAPTVEKQTVSVVHHSTMTPAAPKGKNDDDGTTTIVSAKSNGVLHVDVALDHI